jgi:DNA-binding MurR/RpiR family transcriptional regulator
MQDAIDHFAFELLRIGNMLAGLAADLVEELPDEAYPGEEPAAVVMEMITGSIRTALVEVDQSDVQRAVEIMREAADRVIEHLRLALALGRRMEGGAGTRREYG